MLELLYFLRKKKKNSFNSENGGEDKFEKVFPLLFFQTQPFPELHPSSFREHKSHSQPHMDIAPCLLYGGYNLNLPRWNIPS